ncbi:hypothetical protein TNCV_51051 [Trichonephila clavipes]|nr:hypothetical protein TNCV_51051 [Trichonephila clavipes]
MQEIRDFYDYDTFDDALHICAAEVEDIVDLSEPMNSDSYAEIDNETLTLSNALHQGYLEPFFQPGRIHMMAISCGPQHED